MAKVCVENVPIKREDVNATAWSLYLWTPGGNVPSLRSGATYTDRRHESGCSTPTPAASPTKNLIAYLVEIWTVSWPQRLGAGPMKSDVSQVSSCMVSWALWATGALPRVIEIFCHRYLGMN